MNQEYDFLSLLLDGDGDNSGSFNHANWTVSLAGDTTSSIPRLVTLHESLHSDLNDSTGFGIILHAYAYIVRNNGNQSYTNILNKLVYGCRVTHECFATYLSILIVANTRDENLLPSDILTNYPDYLHYYSIAESLCGDIKGEYLKYHAVTASLRVCMQGQAIVKLIDSDIANFKISDLRQLDFPDSILNEVRDIVSDDYWVNAISEAFNEYPELLGWDIILASENDRSLYRDAMSEKYDETSKRIMQYFHEKITRDLLNKNIIIIEYDGHIQYVNKILDMAYKVVPNSKSIRPLYANNNKYSEESLAVYNFQYERFLITKSPLKAKIYHINNIAKEDWIHLMSGDKENEHFFIISRYMDQLREQYIIDYIESSLRLKTNSPSVFVRHCAIDKNSNERIIELFLIENSNIFTEMHNNYPDTPIVSNISMATLANDSWFLSWFNNFSEFSKISILFDLSPFLHFDAWQQKDKFDIHYSTMNIDIDEKKYFIFACMPQTNLGNIYLIPCSSIVGNSFIYYIKELMKNNYRFIENKDFLYKNKWLAIVAIGHLLREEHFFDFYSYTEKGSTND